jgi:hypothetical protein
MRKVARNTAWALTVLGLVGTGAVLAGTTCRADEAGDVRTLFGAALEAEARGEHAAARAAYERVLALDPEHRAARRALGYVLVDGRWLTAEEARRLTAESTTPKTVPPAAKAPVDPAAALAERLRGAIAAPDAAARARAVAALKEEAPEEAYATFRRGLRHGLETTRVRSAEALALLGDRRAVPCLLSAWETPRPNGVRGHFARVRQLAYVQDYDVEVA